MEETMAVGDSENDYSMINAAGIGVAMGNASDDIKAIADYITTTNEEDGVGEAIKKFIP
jgi:hydroxymethylpyrimidine pyrophosphatase-like HAD family hydrolase